MPPPVDDDDRTRMPEPAPQGASGAPRAEAITSLNALPMGTRLGEFRLTGMIGEGGFGIVYRAHDESLQRVVAIKEYMPSALATRLSDSTVAVKSERYAETFETARRSFINEARLLAQFDHPSLLKVFRFWEANGTAYMAMPLYQGITLKQALADLDGPPDEAWLRNLLSQLLDALEVLHEANCFHRDVAPDNILLVDGGRPVLLDFGAARRVIGDLTRTLTVIVKPGYAPLEQYAESPTLKQGPWTDLYALAGVTYFAISGRTPLPAVARVASDSMTPIIELGAGRYSQGFLRAIDAALAVQPAGRPQSVAEFRRLLGLAEPGRAAQIETRQMRPTIAAVASKPRDGASTTRAGFLRWGGAAVALLGITGAAIHFWQREAKAPEPASASAEAPTPTRPEPATPPTEAAFDPVQALDTVFDGRDPQRAVSVALQTEQIRIEKDHPRFSVSSSQPGYVYLLYVGSDRSEFLLLFPNSVDKNNRIAAGKPLQLPRPAWATVAMGPPGTDHFVVLVSDSPREFSGLGMRTVGRAGFGEFPLDLAAQVFRSHSGPVPVFAGKPNCRIETDANCTAAYGAARFLIEEVATR